MVEKVECPSCNNKGTVLCPCCLGQGWVETGPFTPRLGKAFICVDCSGLGEIPCPRCNPKSGDAAVKNMQSSRMKLRFRRI